MKKQVKVKIVAEVVTTLYLDYGEDISSHLDRVVDIYLHDVNGNKEDLGADSYSITVIK